MHALKMDGPNPRTPRPVEEITQGVKRLRLQERIVAKIGMYNVSTQTDLTIDPHDDVLCWFKGDNNPRTYIPLEKVVGVPGEEVISKN